MSEQTNIQWCDSTLNFWSGCKKVSPGCANCYAESFWIRQGIPKGGRKKRLEAARRDALKWNRKPWVCDHCKTAYAAQIDGCCCDGQIHQLHRRRVFSLSLGDWLDLEVPVPWLAYMLETIDRCPNLDWLLCTKRPELWRERLQSVFRQWRNDIDGSGWSWLDDWLTCDLPPSNVILLASVENQDMADKRIPALLNIPAACHGLSLEPLLGPINVDAWVKQLKWLVIGGESGHLARPCNLEWIRFLLAQGQAAKVPVFCKQLGSNARGHTTVKDSNGPRLNLRHTKGGEPAEWPADLQVREFYEK